ncbi:PilZ domain-containing protein [Sphingomonas sp. PB2P12]|uniref:PilZ domain-containing protein n=1 Tax=Sphingomonas sandaracina TaxID=3096157 RepID=UPI002FCA603F
MATAHNAAFLVDSAERRSDSRVALARTGTLRLHDEAMSRQVRIADLNRDGCRIQSAVPLLLNQQVAIGIPGVGVRDAQITWAGDRDYGCKFDRPLPPGSVTAAMTDNVIGLGTVTGAIRAPATFKWQFRGRLLLLGVLSLAGWTAITLVVEHLLV